MHIAAALHREELLMIKGILKGACVASLIVYGGISQAGSYLSKPVKIIVSFAAGGGVDQVARMVASHWQSTLNGSFIVENRPGASTFIATEAVARSEPDGHTLLLTTQSTFVINPLLFKELPYSRADFTPVGQISTVPSFIAVGTDSKIKSLEELVQQAKQPPGTLSYASAGNGTAGHLGFALLNQRLGTDMIHAPYKSYAASMPDVISGRVTAIMADLPVINGPLKAGKVRLLATSTGERSDFMPEQPTINEALGQPDYSVANWFAVYAPKDTPADVVALLNKELQGFVTSAEGKEKLEAIGHTPSPSTPEQLTELEHKETLNWKPLIETLPKMD